MSTNWYTRPYRAGTPYGTADGLSYANAKEGLGNLTYGEGAILPGDMVWICDIHGYTHSATVSFANTERTVVTQNNVYFRGDSNNAPDAAAHGHDGVIWGTTTFVKGSTGMTAAPYGTNVYYTIYGAGIPAESNIFQDGSPMNLPHKTLSHPPTQAELELFSPGDFGIDLTNNYMYVRPLDTNPATAHDWQLCSSINSRFVATGYSNTHIRSIIIHGTQTLVTDAPNTIIEYCTVDWGDTGIFFWGDCSGSIAQFNTVTKCANGIYAACNPNNTPVTYSNNLTFANNLVNYSSPGIQMGLDDGHGLALQYGSGHIIRNNTVIGHSIGAAIYCDATNPTEDFSFQVYGNFIYGSIQLSNGSFGHGISVFGQPPDSSGNNINGNIYNNIIHNCKWAGLNVFCPNKAGSLLEIYNNTIDSCHQGMFTYDTGTTLGIKLTLKNNIFSNMADKGEYSGWPVGLIWKSGTGIVNITSDYNCFYPATGNCFLWQNTPTAISYATWKDVSHVNGDVNSITTNPLFSNGSGAFSTDTDFQIPGTSPCFRTGTPAGLTTDYFGNPWGPIPDIGAYSVRRAGTAVAARQY